MPIITKREEELRKEFHCKYHTFSHAREKIYKRDNYKCAYCGRRIFTPSDLRKLTIKKQEEKYREFKKGLITKKEYISYNRFSNSDFKKTIKASKEYNQKIGTLDHVIPLSKGGTNAEDNLITCCRSCNSKKGEDIVKGKEG